jgi:glycosyltransferase involved in cell wall biosynthesis
VSSQSLKDWECVVVDDGSTDDTEAVARTYVLRDARFSYVYQENGGLSSARNAGLRNANGEYIQLLDADDLMESAKLEEHVRFLAQRKDYALVYGSMRYFTTRDSVRTFSRGRNGTDGDWVKMWPDTNEPMLLAFVERNQFPVSAAVFRRSVLGEVGYFDESLPSHEDWEFWLRLAFSGKRFFGFDTPGTRTLIREHGRSLTNRSIIMAETRLKVRKRIQDLAATEDLRARNREYSKYDECDLGIAYLAAGHWGIGIRWYFGGFIESDRKASIIRQLLAKIAPGWLLKVFRRFRSALS